MINREAYTISLSGMTYDITDVDDVYWDEEGQIEGYYAAEEFTVYTTDGLEHTVSRDDLDIREENLIDQRVDCM